MQKIVRFPPNVPMDKSNAELDHALLDNLIYTIKVKKKKKKKIELINF